MDDTTSGYNQATQAAFKYCALNCLKIDGTTNYNAEDLNLVVPMYRLIKYSSNYSYMTSNLLFY